MICVNKTQRKEKYALVVVHMHLMKTIIIFLYLQIFLKFLRMLNFKYQ
jgi:hypothetical protein